MGQHNVHCQPCWSTGWHLEAVSLSWTVMLALLLASLSLSGAGSHLRSQKRALQEVVRLLALLRAGVQAGGEAAQALLSGSLGADEQL